MGMLTERRGWRKGKNYNFLMSGIEIFVTEIDDLLEQIIIMVSEYQKKKISCPTTTTMHPNAVASKSSYQEGFHAREKACVTLLGTDLTNNSETESPAISQGSSLQVEPLQYDFESDDIQDFVVIGNDYETLPTKEQEIIATPTGKKNQPETVIKRKSSAQANIMAPKRRKCNSYLKQDTVKYLEKKSEKQYELKYKELGLQERKQLLEENEFEMDRIERQKRLEIEERRLEMEEKRWKVEMDLFANQQELIKILFNKNK
ncbi:unnamed protein product [Phaedon cochleariae]|uniref:Uncharacterized protein n=1 Tax=Phaedon cochleariae TaxID=80249 RepID=A0A9N9SAK3_PHACE|nr:unnamed protein product [Phaedon cochleariae]